MNQHLTYILLSVLAIFLGVFMFVFGGYDDSPGAQGLGALIVIIGIAGIVKNRKKSVR